MQKLRKVLSLLLVAIMALGLCTAAFAEEEVTLKFTYWGSTVEKKAVEEALASFTAAYPHIKVDGQHIPTDYEAKITAMMAGGEAPDVAYLSDTLTNDWGLDGQLYNVLELIEADPDMDADDFIDDIWYSWAPGKAAGTNSALEAYAMYYNKALFDEAGIEYPTSLPEEAMNWDEFVALCKSLTFDQNGLHPDDEGFDPTRIKQYGVRIDTGMAPAIGFIYGNGGSFITEDGTEFAMNRPEATEVLQAMADLINVHHVAPTPAAASSIPEIGTALQTGKVAMYITGQWCLLDLAANDELEFGIGVLPQYGDKYVTNILGSPTVIFSSTQHPEESWLLFKWLANPDSVMNLMAGGLWMPLLKDWYTDEELVAKWAKDNAAHPPEYLDAVMRASMEYGMAVPVYNVKNYGQISALVNPAFDEIWSGAKTAQEAMDGIADEVNKLVDGFYNPDLRTY